MFTTVSVYLTMPTRRMKIENYHDCSNQSYRYIRDRNISSIKHFHSTQYEKRHVSGMLSVFLRNLEIFLAHN